MYLMQTHLSKQSNCSLFSAQPKSVVHACPMVNLWNFNMSMTPTWATAHPKRSGLWFTHAAGGQKSTHSVSGQVCVGGLGDRIHYNWPGTKTMEVYEIVCVCRTHEQTPVGSSIDGEFVGWSVALLYQILSCTLEICETVLLIGQHPRCTAREKMRGVSDSFQISRSKSYLAQLRFLSQKIPTFIFHNKKYILIRFHSIFLNNSREH